MVANILVLALFLYSVHTSQSALRCTSSAQCSPGSHCATSSDGTKVCQTDLPVNSGETTLTSMKIKYCTKNRDCPGIGSRCIIYSWYGVCELSTDSAGVSKFNKKVDEECLRDQDCMPDLQCVHFNGKNQCQLSVKIPPSKACKSNSDCPSDTLCSYSEAYRKPICQRKTSADEGIWVDSEFNKMYLPSASDEHYYQYDTRAVVPNSNSGIGSGAAPFPEIGSGASPSSIGSGGIPYVTPTPGIGGGAIPYATTTPGIGGGAIPYVTSTPAIGGGAIPYVTSTPGIGGGAFPSSSYGSAGVGSGATPIGGSTIPCTSDFQCPSGESCSRWAYISGRNQRVCTDTHQGAGKLCLYNSQCPIGELCERNASGIFVCKHSYSASMERTCVYDYECAGGWKCVNIADGAQKEFRCRPPRQTYNDSSLNRRSVSPCRTKADCGPQQSCVYVESQWQCATTSSY